MIKTSEKNIIYITRMLKLELISKKKTKPTSKRRILCQTLFPKVICKPFLTHDPVALNRHTRIVLSIEAKEDAIIGVGNFHTHSFMDTYIYMSY